MYFGSFNHTIDAKGRTALPAKLREALAAEGEPRLTLVRNQNSRSIMCLTPTLWAQVLARVSGVSPFDGVATSNVLKLVATAHVLEFDGSGRVLVPPDLRSYAGLTKDVVWAGMVNHILLFDKATFEAEVERELPAEQRWDPLAGRS
ncbi:MAG: division/cell wall cluster transcriptional repressor MraZ [Anaeromyxobacter sp.]|nr:division/cell wall cluster transcriptional repressor MraZ [Anaeromyxobacter sp.]MBL0275658.1 division/cell wall cluster transcriptional repressor MraZ [Anaeromyxobacter sp.]